MKAQRHTMSLKVAELGKSSFISITAQVSSPGVSLKCVFLRKTLENFNMYKDPLYTLEAEVQ